MEALQLLSRSEMKNIKAGDGCRVAWRNADGSFAGYSACSTQSVDSIQSAYFSSYENDEGQYVSGYCCSSCGTGQFSNTTAC
ncbi:hypothetical protein [Gracilimonas tropica]|uniref:hypothetical protein n=1 Tax=Gracilimonas tropica TaxID=454600 RepID=UPI0012FA2DFF|nr:hypothetical protein [Gracilimonas tropica]